MPPKNLANYDYWWLWRLPKLRHRRVNTFQVFYAVKLWWQSVWFRACHAV